MKKLSIKIQGDRLLVLGPTPTFRKWWREVCRGTWTGSPSKYCQDPRKVKGGHLIEAPGMPDVIQAIAR